VQKDILTYCTSRKSKNIIAPMNDLQMARREARGITHLP